MINFSELDKIVTSGKTITIVVLADSKEVFAISFDSATLAYKHLLAAGAAVITAPVIKDKPDSTDVAKVIKDAGPIVTGDGCGNNSEPDIAPEDVDIETGEIIEELIVEEKPKPQPRKPVEPKAAKVTEPKPEKEIKQPGTALTGNVIDDDDWGV